jgi:flagellar biosynthesis/type III secretory pathway chaperone
VDIGPCRELLGKLLQDELTVLAQLEGLLGEEHDVLLNNDIDGFERTGQARQTCMGDLLRLEDERRSLCSMLGRSPDLAGLDNLLAWCDPTRSMQPRWAECATRAKRCRDLNDRNGMLVTGRLHRVQGLLNILTGQSKPPETYGRKGAYAAASAGRVLKVEA